MLWNGPEAVCSEMETQASRVAQIAQLSAWTKPTRAFPFDVLLRKMLTVPRQGHPLRY